MVNALIVLYNKKILDSSTFNYLNKKRKDINIIIFDNSSEEYVKENEKYANRSKIAYYTFHKNVGISKAYNFVVDKIKKSDKDYLVVLDDDTCLNDNYFKELMSEAERSEYDVLLPRIKAGDMYISPAEVKFDCKIKAIKTFSNIDLSKISAINSGMVVKTSVFLTIAYNEKLFLDYVDHDFMKRVRKEKKKIKIMDSVIVQNFSRFQKNDKDKEQNRFRIYIRDFRQYCKECGKMPYYFISTMKYRAHQVIKYKSISFLFIK